MGSDSLMLILEQMYLFRETTPSNATRNWPQV